MKKQFETFFVFIIYTLMGSCVEKAYEHFRFSEKVGERNFPKEF